MTFATARQNCITRPARADRPGSVLETSGLPIPRRPLGARREAKTTGAEKAPSRPEPHRAVIPSRESRSSESRSIPSVRRIKDRYWSVHAIRAFDGDAGEAASVASRLHRWLRQRPRHRCSPKQSARWSRPESPQRTPPDRAPEPGPRATERPSTPCNDPGRPSPPPVPALRTKDAAGHAPSRTPGHPGIGTSRTTPPMPPERRGEMGAETGRSFGPLPSRRAIFCHLCRPAVLSEDRAWGDTNVGLCSWRDRGHCPNRGEPPSLLPMTLRHAPLAIVLRQRHANATETVVRGSRSLRKRH